MASGIRQGSVARSRLLGKVQTGTGTVTPSGRPPSFGALSVLSTDS